MNEKPLGTWRCYIHGIITERPIRKDDLWTCPEPRQRTIAGRTVNGICGATLIAQRPNHPEIDDAPDFVVFRDTGNSGVDGAWIDRAQFGGDEIGTTTDPGGSLVPCVPTGEFETRGDGQVAEIWRPRSIEEAS